MIEYAPARVRTRAHEVRAKRMSGHRGSVMKHVALFFSFALLLAGQADARRRARAAPSA